MPHRVPLDPRWRLIPEACSLQPETSICRHFTIVSPASVRYNSSMTETKNNFRQDWLSVPRRREEERLYPHGYKRGIKRATGEEEWRGVLGVRGAAGKADCEGVSDLPGLPREPLPHRRHPRSRPA